MFEPLIHRIPGGGKRCSSIRVATLSLTFCWSIHPRFEIHVMRRRCATDLQPLVRSLCSHFARDRGGGPFAVFHVEPIPALLFHNLSADAGLAQCHSVPATELSVAVNIQIDATTLSGLA